MAMRRGRKRSSVWRTVSFSVVPKTPSSRCSSSLGSSSRRSAWSAWVATTTPSKRRSSSPREPQLDAAVEAADRADLGREVDAQPLLQGAHVGPAAAGDRLPAEAPEAEDAVVGEEADGVDEREVERLAGSGRPERGAERDEEVVPEPRRVALLGDVAGEAPLRAARVVESPAPEAQEAGDLERQPRERRAAARVLEVVPVAGDREAHLRRLRAHAELAEEADEVRVGVLVVNDEAGVERQRPSGDHVLDRVRVAPGATVALEQLDLVALRERVGRSQARDARADHCDLHLHTLDNT